MCLPFSGDLSNRSRCEACAVAARSEYQNEDGATVCQVCEQCRFANHREVHDCTAALNRECTQCAAGKHTVRDNAPVAGLSAPDSRPPRTRPPLCALLALVLRCGAIRQDLAHFPLRTELAHAVETGRRRQRSGGRRNPVV